MAVPGMDDTHLEYQRSVRGRAAESHHELRQAFSTDPTVSPMQKHYIQGGRYAANGAGSKELQPEHSDYTYGAAAGHLKMMLKKNQPKSLGPKDVQFGPRPHRSYTTDDLHPVSHSMPVPPLYSLPRSGGPIPSPEEALGLLQQQTAYLQQLEAENRYAQGELKAVQLKIREVVQENQQLHEELKRSVVQEILQQDFHVEGLPQQVPEHLRPSPQQSSSPPAASQTMTRADFNKWQRELERISALHIAKVNRLEQQLERAKRETEESQREVEDLNSRLRIQESMAVDGLNTSLSTGICIRCAQNESLLPKSYAGDGSQAVQRLTSERDELMDHLTTLKRRLEESRQREEEAYQQVKQSVQMVEQSQMEQTQALVEKEQVKEELDNMRQRLQEHLQEVQVQVQKERDIVREENKQERDKLNFKIHELSEKLTATQLEFDKMARVKVTLQAELEQSRLQISTWDNDYGKATDSMKLSITSATTERNAAFAQMKRYKTELSQLQRDRDEERMRLKTDLENVRRRMMIAERDLVESKEECINLHNVKQDLERELHMAKLAKDSIERTRTDDVKGIQKRAEQRETELNTLIDQMEVKHNAAVNDLEDMLNSQNSLVGKLREECRRLAHQLEDVTTKYRTDNKHLKNKVEQLSMKLERALTRQKELEGQTHRHAELHDKMRNRLRQMDGHAHHTGQQILDLLVKESNLMKERQLLAKEVEFLRRQFSDREDSNTLYYSGRPQVDEILRNVNAQSGSSQGKFPLPADFEVKITTDEQEKPV